MELGFCIPSSRRHLQYAAAEGALKSPVIPDPVVKMQNEEGQNMDLYIPRKCSATNRLITSKDHASVQINVGHLDESGRYVGQFSTFALCGEMLIVHLTGCGRRRKLKIANSYFCQFSDGGKMGIFMS
ncbi:hypothetical protein LXL04_038928 [Taraxacum kok-saghyz]